MRKENVQNIIKYHLDIATQVLNEAEPDSTKGYAFTVGVLENSIKKICEAFEVSPEELFKAINKNVKRNSIYETKNIL